MCRLFSCCCACSEIVQLMVLLRPTRPHAVQLVFHCLDLSKDPNWSSCMHPENHLAMRDCHHLCRSPPCSSCFLHIKNLLVDVLDLFFHSGAPKRFFKKLVQLLRGRPQSECMSRTAFRVSTSSKSRPETSSPRFNSTCHFPCSRQHLRKHLEATQHSEIVDFLPCLELRRWTAKARDA